MNQEVVHSLWSFEVETICREMYQFQKSLQERHIVTDCLLLLDKDEVPKGLDDISARIVRVSSLVMKKLSGMQSSESIEAIALMKLPTSFCNFEDNQKEVDWRRIFPCVHRILVLDGIQVTKVDK